MYKGNQDRPDNFDKFSQKGRKGNLPTRVDILEKNQKRMQGQSIDNYLTEFLATNQIVINNYITPSVIDNSINWQAPFVFDDFISSYFDTASGVFTVGDLGWLSPFYSYIAVSNSLSIASDSHPGVVQIGGGGGGDNFIALLPMKSVDTVNLMQFAARFEVTGLANEGYVLGLMGSSFHVTGTGEGVYFKFENGDTNWQCVTTYTGSTTANDSGVAFAADTWFLFEIKRTATNTFEFYINQVLVGTHLSDYATSPRPVFGMSDQGTGYSIFLDYFGMQLAPITQRWD